MLKNKLNPAQILSKANEKYRLLKNAKSGSENNQAREIQSDQVKAVVETLCEEINKILEDK